MRILFVAMAYSVHTARWVSQLADTRWDVHVFDMQEGTVGHELSGVTAYTFCPPARHPTGLRALHTAWPFRRGAYAAQRYLPPMLRRALLPSRVETLAELIPRLQPDILHSLEMQHQTYPLLEVSRKLGGRFAMPWIYSSWGSDLYLFKDEPAHGDRIREVLGRCDYYVPDCQRDVGLARDLGFAGDIPGVFLVCGGIDVAASRQWVTPGPASARRIVAVKGYQGWAGRALTALRALETCVDVLAGYTVEIYLADATTCAAARSLSVRTGIPIRIIPPGPPAAILQLMGRARVAVGLSISDGSPLSMIEAMMMGALPIQSDTGSTAEWIDAGKNGLLVSPEDWQATGEALRRALTDDRFVDAAAVVNLELIRQRVDASVVRPQVLTMYSRIARQVART
jgi:hypothetical protein